MYRQVTIAVCLTAALSSAVSAQEPLNAPTGSTQTVTEPNPEPTFINVVGISNDYQVGPGDLLEIKVIDNTDLDQTLRVSAAGEISYPMLGLLRVGDLSAFEVEDLIATQLRNKGLIERPDVLVSVTEYHAKPIYVSGAVFTPKEFVMSQELTVADALLLAGGLRFNAADDALLYRRVSRRKTDAESSGSDGPAVTGGPGSDTEIIKVDLKPFKEGRFLEASLKLRRGDAIVVPDRQTNPFYVVGEVIDPRNYFFVPGKEMTVSQAVSMAGGPTATAKLSAILIVRTDTAGRREDITVDFVEILEGKQQDVVIHSHDVIFVPGSKVKTITHGMAMLTDEYILSETFRVGRRMQMPDGPEDR
jgi:polysaccharide export outer membrane protein